MKYLKKNIVVKNFKYVFIVCLILNSCSESKEIELENAEKNPLVNSIIFNIGENNFTKELKFNYDLNNKLISVNSNSCYKSDKLVCNENSSKTELIYDSSGKIERWKIDRDDAPYEKFFSYNEQGILLSTDIFNGHSSVEETKINFVGLGSNLVKVENVLHSNTYQFSIQDNNVNRVDLSEEDFCLFTPSNVKKPSFGGFFPSESSSYLYYYDDLLNMSSEFPKEINIFRNSISSFGRHKLSFEVNEDNYPTKITAHITTNTNNEGYLKTWEITYK
jgi:hypothetical protein